MALVCALLPLYLIVTTSFKLGRDAFAMPPKWIFSPTTEHYAKVFSESRFVDTYWNSLVISFGSVGVAILVGLPAAYALTRYQFRGKGLMTQLFLGSRIFPQIAILIPLFVAWTYLGLRDTLVGLTLAYVQLNLAMVIWMLRGFLLDFPIELEEAAWVDGASRLGAFWRVILPLVVPGVAATCILGVIFSWNEFLFALALSARHARPVTVTVYNFLHFEEVQWGQLHAAGTLVMLPVLIFALLVQRYIVRGLVSGALK
ncbi:MAG: carbohydrate ABC transporter permease [Candidatus Rokubacteria bacterium]|nr:carbohydrate ABC transporter permease [Candidatus Rokubacteria bacterium]